MPHYHESDESYCRILKFKIRHPIRINHDSVYDLRALVTYLRTLPANSVICDLSTNKAITSAEYDSNLKLAIDKSGDDNREEDYDKKPFLDELYTRLKLEPPFDMADFLTQGARKTVFFHAKHFDGLFVYLMLFRPFFYELCSKFPYLFFAPYFADFLALHNNHLFIRGVNYARTELIECLETEQDKQGIPPQYDIRIILYRTLVIFICLSMTNMTEGNSIFNLRNGFSAVLLLKLLSEFCGPTINNPLANRGHNGVIERPIEEIIYDEPDEDNAYRLGAS